MNNLIIALQQALGFNIVRVQGDFNASDFGVVQLISGKPIECADDDFNLLENTYRLNLFIKGDYSLKKRTAINTLKEYGAYSIFVNGDIFEKDTKFNHIPIDFKTKELI